MLLKKVGQTLLGALLFVGATSAARADDVPFVVKGDTTAVGCSAPMVVLSPAGQMRVEEANCYGALALGGAGELSFESAGQPAKSCGLVRMVRNAAGLLALFTDAACIETGDDNFDFDGDGVPDKDDVDPITANLAMVVKDGLQAVKCGPVRVVLTSSGEIQVQDADTNCFGAIADGGVGSLSFQSGGVSKYCSLDRLVQNPIGQVALYAVAGCIRAGDDTLDFDGDGIADKDDPDPLSPASSSCISGSADLTIDNAGYLGTVQITGCSITAGTSVQVGSAAAPAAVTYIAETMIHLLPGFGVAADSSFYAGIGTTAPAPRQTKAAGSSSSSVAQRDPRAIPGAQRVNGDALPDDLAKLLAGAQAGDIATDETGQYLVFTTDAALDPWDGNGLADVYLWDRQEGRLLLVSRTPDGASGDGASGQPRIDGSGSYIVYTSWASDIAEGAGDGASGILLYHIATGTTESASGRGASDQPQGDARNPAISSASPEVFYDRIDADGTRRVYRYDADWPAIDPQVESLEGSLDAAAPGVSPDGRYLAYRETGDGCSIILRDRPRGGWVRADCPDGMAAEREYIPFFSDDGGSLEWVEVDPLSGELLEGAEPSPIWMENPLPPVR